MKYYLVGTPESFFTVKPFFSVKQRKFSKKEIVQNLQATDDLRLFASLEDAREYARSLRMYIPSKFREPSTNKVAPVVTIDLQNSLDEREFNNKNQKREEVTIRVYKGVYSKRKSTVTFVSALELNNFSLKDINVDSVEFPDSGYPETKFNPMSSSFFHALNPVKKNSGITYCLLKPHHPLQGKEMLDATVGSSIHTAFKSDLNFLSGLNATFNILVGEHFDLSGKGSSAKGVLDFLILPLLARKLIADTCLPERQGITFINALAFAIAAPIEIARFGAGIALTLLLSPIVALVHLIKACLPKQEHIGEVVQESNFSGKNP